MKETLQAKLGIIWKWQSIKMLSISQKNFFCGYLRRLSVAAMALGFITGCTGETLERYNHGNMPAASGSASGAKSQSPTQQNMKMSLTKAEPLPRLILERQNYTNLSGWMEDDLKGFRLAMKQSCRALEKRDKLEIMVAQNPLWGTVNDWLTVCQSLLTHGSESFRSSLEHLFTPWRITASELDEKALFTGYYEPTLRGSFRFKPPYIYPLFPRPADLVQVDLGVFRPSLMGTTLYGRLNENGILVPYYDRAAINRGAMENGPLPIAWVDDAADLFFLHIQGSGVIKFEDGTTLRAGYAGQNGHKYFAIGRYLVAHENLPIEDISMQSIRDWLKRHPHKAEATMEMNPSYIFFKEVHGEGPIGSQGVPLVPMRSIAIDKSLYPLGAPFWLDIESPEDKTRIRHLSLAQDTGGAISGVVRADLFWGRGARAEAAAGKMRSTGTYWILAPKSLDEQIESSIYVLK